MNAIATYRGRTITSADLAFIRQLIADSGFNSPTDFVVYVLRDILSETGRENREEFSPEEIRALKQKLRNLGYLE